MSPLTNWLKRHTTFGFRRALAELVRETRLLRRHRAGLRRARRMVLPPDAKVQLGSGGQPKPGWINIDLFAEGADVVLDLREDLPFPDDSIRAIYSEHIFEHFAYPADAKHLLRESLRVLAPGGTFSLVVPDAGALLHAYVGDDRTFFEHDRLRSYLLEEHPTFMHHVNYWFRQDGLHRYAYDAETLAQVLRDAGFTDVRVREYDPGLDSEKRYRLHSLFMEGVKTLDRPIQESHEAIRTPARHTRAVA
jgi:predicted SAM-dependent methyltransferase